LDERNAEEDKTVHWQITALWGGKKVELRETQRAVTPFGGAGGVLGVAAAGWLSRSREQVSAVSSYFPQCRRSGGDLHGFLTFGSGRSAALARTSLLRADVALHAVLGISRFPADDTIRNLFKRFGQGQCQRFFSGLWSWQLERLPGCSKGRGLSYIIVARLTLWLKREAARVTARRALGEHYAAGEFFLQLFGWDRPRRFVVIRERLRAERPSLGRKLLDVPGYTLRVFVSNLALPPEELWRDCNHRADMENRIAELKHDLGADDFCMQEFFATEAAFRGILLLFNLLGEFQRASGCKTYRQPATLRAQVFLCGALLGRAGRRLVLHLSASNHVSHCWKTSYPTVSQLRRSCILGSRLEPKIHQ
jgi:hypothetical protein